MAGTPDEYERRYMDGAQAVLRLRQRQPSWVPLLLLALIGITAVSLLPMLSAIWHHRENGMMSAFFATVLAVFVSYTLAAVIGALASHITRVVVTPTHLRVHRGLHAHDIPIASISAARVDIARWWRPPGTARGRLSGRERIYVHFGARESLRVDWRDAKGRDRTTWIQLDAAAEACAVLDTLLAQRTGVRVEASTHAPTEPELDEVANANREGKRTVHEDS